MHIAFHYPGLNLGGQQTFTLRLMAELAAGGSQVTWIYHHGDALLDDVRRHGVAHRVHLPPFNAGKYGVQRVANRLVYRTLGTLQLLQYCRREGVDALVSANTPDSILGARVAARSRTRHFRLLGGSMKQVEPHWLAAYPSLGIDQRTSGYFGWPAVLDELNAVGVATEKLVVLPMAVDAERHFPITGDARRRVRASLGLPADVLVIGWLGRVARNMQVWDTVELARRLTTRGFEDFRLLFVGGGDALPALEQELEASGLSARSILTGWVPYERVNELTNAMDIVPLLEHDPHGGSIVREAMAAGRVALSVDGPSGVQAEFMVPGTSVLVPSDGYLDHAADEVIRLAADRTSLERMGTAAAQHARARMSFRRVAEAFLQGIEARS